MIVQFLLSLSLLIILHECGHFFPARWFKTRVEKFYLFFDYPSKLISKKIGDTEYGIGMLPLGGYVKISGMVDESLDTEQMKLPPQPWEFRSKKAWQRLIIMLGGVTVNFLLGFFIFGMLLWHYGEEYVPNANAKYGIYADSLGQKFGLMTGDKIKTVGTKPLERFNDREVLKEIVFNGARTITVDRKGEEKTITLPEDATSQLTKFENKDKSLFTLPVPFVVDSVLKDKPAEKAGLKKGDAIVSVNDILTPFYNDFTQLSPRYAGKPVVWKVKRGNDTISMNAQSNEKDGKYGIIANADLKQFYTTEKQTYSLAQAIPMGFNKGMDFLVNQVKAFGKMFRGEINPKESVGGFKSIAKMFGTNWDWERFWIMTASLSLILAFMNLLPIPALDGGYVMFLLWEIITGRKVSDHVMERFVTIGFFFMLGLIVVVNLWDIIR